MQEIIVFITAAAFSSLLAPATIRCATKWSFMDKPGARKIHVAPKPCLGGAVIFLSFLTTTLFFIPLSPKVLIILGGAVFYFILGLADDRQSLPAGMKFVAEIIVSTIIVLLGIKYGYLLSNPFGQLGASFVWLSVPFYVFWIVGIANAVNLIDGLDALASGVVLIACFVLSISALLIPVISLNPLLLAIMGSLIGYIRFNLYPSKIIMGDNGSLFLGYLVAIISLVSYVNVDRSIFLSIIPPAMALFVPILDTTLAVIRRGLNGRKIFSPDQNHLHHHLLKNYSHPRAVHIIWILSFSFGMISVLLSYLIEKQVYIALTVLAIVCVWSLFSARQMGLFRHKVEKLPTQAAMDTVAISREKESSA
ncbi:MAG: undecaprenyl/decaprenyl-phosphate alpha-N-acetylglucosaminyl 1-phosphate transferase [Firmicutes bacterium]|nr:undecaprenyl/decaprenyl-phosphate alpha-N-acetylglucosaminyl 1-phosphate transferase [Bacillota bacterium]